MDTLAQLVIAFDSAPIFLETQERPQLVYRIGAVGPIDGSWIDINEASRLQEIALELRDDYAKWIYSLNDEFSSGASPFPGASSFLLSDCSCKRTEFFDTFNLICNLVFLREIIEAKRPSSIEVYGGDIQFARSLAKIAPGVSMKVHRVRRFRDLGVRRLLSDIRYCVVVAVITLLSSPRNRLSEKMSVGRRALFTVFPKMYDLEKGDRKYGGFFRREDHYVASIITDGLHQRVSVREYRRHRLEAAKRGISVIDDFFEHSDWIWGLIWMIPLRLRFRLRREICQFSGIDVFLWIREELQVSASRLSRFVVLSRAITRFIRVIRVKEFVYYLHEYPMGRLFSLLLSVHRPEVEKMGYQHGPAAWTKMLYCMDPQESQRASDFTKSVPMPDRVFAEDNKSADIYRHSGYRNVEVLDKIWRLGYLDRIRPAPDRNCWLIAPGLHDGYTLLTALEPLLREEFDKTVLLRPHPLARNEYLSGVESRFSLKITSEPIPDLFSRVGAVFVSYSSIGEEALKLGIPVYLVQIPGVVSESPLADLQPDGGWITPQ